MNDKTELNGHSVVACTYSSEDMSSFDYASGIDAADVLASLSQEEVNFECPAYNTRKASFSLYEDDAIEYDEKPQSKSKTSRKTTKVGWTKDECDKLRTLVEGYANKRKISWIEIAKHFHGKRNAKRCREKWVEYLDPQLSGAPFTPQDDAFILKSQAAMGNRWRDIAQMMTNRRSATAVKVRWHQLRDRGQNLSLPLNEVPLTRSEDECVTDRSGTSGASSAMSLQAETVAQSTDSSAETTETLEEIRSKQLVWTMPPPKRQRKASPPLVSTQTAQPLPMKQKTPVISVTPVSVPCSAPILNPSVSYPNSSTPMMPQAWPSYVNQPQMQGSPHPPMSMYSMNYMPMMLYPQPNNYADVSSMYPFLMQQPVYYGCPKCGPSVVCRGHASDHSNQELPN